MSKTTIWRLMTRRKPMPEVEESSKMGKVFGTFDLTALGVSATLGVGVYVLAGHVARDQAGPSVVLSFLIAAAASFLAGLCYAEFASRVPKSGSAYIFTYVAIGEFMAFIVGWNLILEYVIGAASISKGLSLYIDSLANNTMKNCFESIAPIHSDFFADYFDFFSFGGPLLIGCALAFGLSKSARINNIFCIFNLAVVIYVVIVVFINADINYWQINPENITFSNATNTTHDIGAGGFFPFGISGMLKGAATCFFGFVGFDCIATTGEEVKNPKKTVPKALLLSLLIIFLAYFGVSLLTLMYPYYLLDPNAPIPHVLEELGWIRSKWLITLGGVIALIASLFGAMFPLPRILYAMAQDGLIFREFAFISQRFKTPVIATLCAAALTALFAALFDLSALVSMLSIGVLLAYTVVAISIIILRFSHSNEPSPTVNECYIETSNLLRPINDITTKGFVMQLIRLNSSRQPSSISIFVVGTLVMCYCIACLGLSCTIHYSWDSIANGETWALVILFVLLVVVVSICVFMSIQPQKRFLIDESETFKVPLVPILPALSIFINIYLMIMLDFYTWIRFGIWMLLGLFVYYPSAWLYNINSHDEATLKNIDTSNLRSVEIQKDEMTADVIKNTCGIEENVIIVHENNLASVEESFINNEHEKDMKNENDEEANIVIELLDTVLKAADEMANSSQSINDNVVEKIEVAETEHYNDSEGEIQNHNHFVNENESIKIMENRMNDINRDEIESEIDEILQEAILSIAEIEKVNETQTSTENVFQNHDFLSHLNNLISKSASNNVSKTIGRRKPSTSSMRVLRHSKSVPDFKATSDVNQIEYNFNDDNVDSRETDVAIPLPPPLPTASPIFTIHPWKKKIDDENLVIRRDVVGKIDDVDDDEEEVIKNRGNIRDKLEKLLQSAPSRFSLNATPIPLPRTKFNDESIPTAEVSETPINSTMKQKQKLLFSEVLKSIPHQHAHDDEDKVDA